MKFALEKQTTNLIAIGHHLWEICLEDECSQVLSDLNKRYLVISQTGVNRVRQVHHWTTLFSILLPFFLKTNNEKKNEMHYLASCLWLLATRR